NTAIFSVVHAVALQGLPAREPDRLVRVWEKNDKLQIPRFSASVPNYYSWTERAPSFEQMGTWRQNASTLTTGGDPRRVSQFDVTWTLLPMLRVTPIAGRTFTADEDRPGAPRVVILAESLWRSRFGADPAMIGRQLALNDVPHTVVGIVADRDLVVAGHVFVPPAGPLREGKRADPPMTASAR